MKWNVLVQKINTRKIEQYNIFNHASFKKEVEVALATCKTKEEFAEKLKRELRYYFWSKCEWEVIVTEWPTHVTTAEIERLNREVRNYSTTWGRPPHSVNVNLPVAEKIDVFDQVMMNWDCFLDYIWNYKG